MKKIILRSNKNLEARVNIPINSKKAIIIAHSFRNDMDEPTCIDAERVFQKKGYAVLNFSFLGYGKSSGKLRDVSWKSISENISSAIKYLREKKFQKIGIYAISFGAIAAVLSAEKPTSQVFLSPTPLYNPDGLLKRYKDSIRMEDLKTKGYSLAMSGSGRGSFEIGKEWIDEMQNEKGKVLKIHKQKKIPTLIIQGTKDPSYNPVLIKKFMETSKDKYFEIPGADHNFTDENYRKIAINKALEWFDKTL